MLLFYALYEGIVAFLTPIIITQAGFSKTMLGLIFGSSSIAGALFDFFLCRVIRHVSYRRLFLFVYVLCVLYPILLLTANSITLFLLAMGVWGIYYDLKNIANLDYVGRFTDKKEHVNSFGMIMAFQTVGFLIGPIVAGALLAEAFAWRPIVMAWIFLSISFCFFLGLLFLTRGNTQSTKFDCMPNRGIKAEWRLWRKLGKVLFPVLILSLYINMIDASFWTIGPLIGETFSHMDGLAGLVMTAYTLPGLLVGWGIGVVTKRFGKKRTAFLNLLIGSLFLMLLPLYPNSILLLVGIFVAALFYAGAFPSISGAYADYVSETKGYEKEIEGLQDCYANAGYIVGPMMAGFFADQFGNLETFFLIGLLGAIIALILLFTATKPINVRKQLRK